MLAQVRAGGGLREWTPLHVHLSLMFAQALLHTQWVIAFSLSNSNGENKVEPAASLSHSYVFMT